MSRYEAKTLKQGSEQHQFIAELAIGSISEEDMNNKYSMTFDNDESETRYSGNYFDIRLGLKTHLFIIPLLLKLTVFGKSTQVASYC